MQVVVVCPRCKGATAVREDQKRATCPRCGRSYDPRRCRVYHRGEDPSEVARVVGGMNARLEGGFKRYEADRGMSGAPKGDAGEDLERVVSRLSLAKGRRRQMEMAVDLLSSREGGTFSSDELVSVLVAVGWPGHAVEDALRGLVESGDVTECRPDTFRRA